MTAIAPAGAGGLSLAARKNTIAFVSGMKGSGKSELLAEMFVSRSPRLISIDVTGETAERNPDAIVTHGLDQLWDALDVAADYDRWHIAAALEDSEIPELFSALAPRLTDSEPGVSRLFGGVGLECGEIDTVAPNGRTHPLVKDGWKRGRHHLLDIYAGTQRPAECDRIVTSQADVIAFFAATEGRELDFIGRALSKAVAHRVAALPRYHFAWFERGQPFVLLCSGPVGARRVYAVLDMAGTVVKGSLENGESQRWPDSHALGPLAARLDAMSDPRRLTSGA